MKVTTEIIGLEHAIRQFKRAPDVARKHIGGAVQVTEITLAGRVRAAAPKDTGALKHAIGSKTTGLNARITIEGGLIYGQYPAVYGPMVEFGTRNRAATPFIRPTAETEQQPFIKRVEDAGTRLERELDS